MGFVTFTVCLVLVVTVILVGVLLHQLYDITNTKQKQLDKWAMKAALISLAVSIVVTGLCVWYLVERWT